MYLPPFTSATLTTLPSSAADPDSDMIRRGEPAARRWTVCRPRDERSRLANAAVDPRRGLTMPSAGPGAQRQSARGGHSATFLPSGSRWMAMARAARSVPVTQRNCQSCPLIDSIAAFDRLLWKRAPYGSSGQEADDCSEEACLM